ncbi:hypothetical protein [Streptococcus sp. Marseille-P7376]|uniref:hypothetical protein n=1 Tax=Streptococcus sp. Marseille-P7376 TaxID=2592044 RepID=UPI0011E734D9|nr:hypothetical protein [Streptococcus sp. Marseille-P7376]
MRYDKAFSDKKKVNIALQEYEIKKVNQEIKLKDGGYVGTVAQIYDNVHGNEEQFSIFTNFYQ